VFSYELPCSECDGTGQKWATAITTKNGASAVIHGSAPLDEESQGALSRIIDAAFKAMGEK
jgi:hypothetical protein